MKYDIDEYDDDDNFTEKLQLLQSTQNISISHPRSRVGGSKIKSKKGSRCGKCEGCNQDDCGQCKACGSILVTTLLSLIATTTF